MPELQQVEAVVEAVQGQWRVPEGATAIGFPDHGLHLCLGELLQEGADNGRRPLQVVQGKQRLQGHPGQRCGGDK